MLHLRVYGPSGSLTAVGEGLEDHGEARRVAIAQGVRSGHLLLTAEIHPDSTDSVLEYLMNAGIGREDIALARFDEVGPVASGHPATSLIWADVIGQARVNARPIGRYLVFMMAAGVIAGFGVIEVNSILIVGAMAVSPDLLPLTAACVGIVSRRTRLALGALVTLLVGLGATCLMATLLTFVLDLFGRFPSGFDVGESALSGLTTVDVSTVGCGACRGRGGHARGRDARERGGRRGHFHHHDPGCRLPRRGFRPGRRGQVVGRPCRPGGQRGHVAARRNADTPGSAPVHAEPDLHVSGPDTPSTKAFAVLLLLAAVVGLVVSFAAWGFLELVYQIQVGVWDDLPGQVGYDDGAPLWWGIPVLGLAGVIVAFAIERLPGNGGHVPAEGLKTEVTQPVELPGVMLAAVATIGLGVVLGPEAPLIALGGGLGLLAVRLIPRDLPPEVSAVIGASGTFAALSLIFDSPLVAAVILIEASGIGGERLPLVLVPGMLAAGIGSLVSTGLGSWTGLSSSDYALGTLDLPNFARPDVGDFGWTIALAVACAVGVFVVVRLGREAEGVLTRRRFLSLPVAGIAVAALAIAFSETADKGVDQVLFSGQDALGPLVTSPAAWSLSALALLIAFKGIAWSISLGGFRGGPVFPSLFLGAAAGVMAAHLPGFSVTPAVAVGMGAAVVSVLNLPLSAVVLAVLLTGGSGAGAGPLIIVGVVVAFLTTRILSGLDSSEAVSSPAPEAPVPR